MRLSHDHCANCPGQLCAREWHPKGGPCTYPSCRGKCKGFDSVHARPRPTARQRSPIPKKLPTPPASTVLTRSATGPPPAPPVKRRPRPPARGRTPPPQDDDEQMF